MVDHTMDDIRKKVDYAIDRLKYMYSDILVDMVATQVVLESRQYCDKLVRFLDLHVEFTTITKVRVDQSSQPEGRTYRTVLNYWINAPNLHMEHLEEQVSILEKIVEGTFKPLRRRKRKVA